METKKASPLNYAFAIGKIRALEKFLLRNEVFQKAIESDLAEALRLFVESDLYSEDLLHVRDSKNLEMLLNQELLKLKNLMQELLLDKELLGLLEIDNLKEAKRLIESFSSPFLKDYLMYLIDMHNIKTFLRLYFLKEPFQELEQKITCEGFIKKQLFLRLFAEDLHVFLHRLEYVHKKDALIDYASYLTEAIKKIEKENSFVALEKAINDFLIWALKPAKYISFGPEPLLAYYFAKVNEINLMRMIILAKLNDVSADLVKERLNVVYA